MLKLSILCGNPKAESRTLGIAKALVEQLLADGSYELTVIDLAEHSDQIFNSTSDTIPELIESIAACDLLVVASPTYKATYTGMLKAFLDRFQTDGLKDIVTVPVMTGGSLAHSMGPEVNLRPLLVELGASIPTKGLYVVVSDADTMNEQIETWMEANSTSLRRIAGIADAVRPTRVTEAGYRTRSNAATPTQRSS